MMTKSAGKFANLAVAVHGNVDGALECLVRTYQDRLFSYALHLLANSFDAQEVTQDTFLRAHRALTTRYDEAKCAGLVLGPWLYRITRNLAHNRRRTHRSRREISLEEFGDGHVSPLRCPPEAARGLEATEQTRTLQLALERLNPEGRDVILLRFMEEMSYAEIAAIIGTNEASVRGKVFRALGKLRSALGKKTGGRNAL
jgi:RNA polymerase sigma factor (sigma-70 family)